MEQTPTPEQTPSSKATWLADLESKSWSLEMTISGAATVAVSFLPGLIERGLNYYLENLAPSESKFATMFPILSYSFFMVVAWVLIVFFVAHLCIRALWVGSVGLHSAFPNGIQYERLPNVTDAYKQLAQERYGTLEAFILRLDKLGNRMFALSFVLSMGLGGIGILYLALFALMLIARMYLDTETLYIIGMILYWAFMLLGAGLLGFNWWIKRNPHQQQASRKMAKIQLAAMYVTTPIFSRPMMYLTMTFMSNTKPRNYYKWVAVVTLFMVISTMFVSARKINNWRGNTGFFERSIFSSGSDQYTFSESSYDALRPEHAAMPHLSIPSEQVNGEFLPVFVQFPRFLNNRLEGYCQLVENPLDTLLSKRLYRQKTDSLRLDCIQKMIQITLNDSIRPATEWLFTEKNGSKGLVTYLNTSVFPSGKNTLLVRIPSEEKADSLEVYGSLHFWFSSK